VINKEGKPQFLRGCGFLFARAAKKAAGPPEKKRTAAGLFQTVFTGRGPAKPEFSPPGPRETASSRT